MSAYRRNAQIHTRRLLVIALGAVLVGKPPLLRAQTSAASLRRVGVLAPSTPAKEEVVLKPFFDEMRLLGWIEGQTITYDRAYAADRQQDLPRLAVELVARKPELVYAPPMIAAVAARQATRGIPIVFATGSDPVRAGLVKSLAHPGGNVTGLVTYIDSLAPKRAQLLRELLPAARRLGFLGDPTDPRTALDRNTLVSAASALGLTIVAGEASNPLEFDQAVARLLAQGVDAILTIGTITSNLGNRLVELASRGHVPVVGHQRNMAEAGALFSYGSSITDQIRRSARLVDKVLKGATPADMAVEQATKFELVINLKSARALGIAVPQSLLLRADEVIQ